MYGISTIYTIITLNASSPTVVPLSFIIVNIVKVIPRIVDASHLVSTDHAPKDTATAFPLLNLNIGEKACPNTPARAEITIIYLFSTIPSVIKMARGKAPFK